MTSIPPRVATKVLIVLNDMGNAQDKTDEHYGSAVEFIALFLSGVFHPLILPAVAFTFMVVADQSLDMRHKFLFEGISIFFSVILVTSYIFFLKQRGCITSTDIILREQRINPLLFGALSYFMGFLFLMHFGAPTPIQGLMFCYAIVVLPIVLITSVWKISVHTTAISIPLVAMTSLIGDQVLPFFSLIPLVGISRLVLKRHTFAQVVAGALIGVSMTAFLFRIFFIGT